MLSEGGRRSASVVEPVSVLTISRSQPESALGGASGVQALMVRMLGQQVHRLSAQLVAARFVPVRHRVARALLELCDQYAATGTRVSLRVAQDDVAGLAGATRPTVNQVLRSLESAGAIELRRGRIDVVGPSYAHIARDLFVAPTTVSYHLSNIYRKCGVRTRHELTELARGMAPAAAAAW